MNESRIHRILAAYRAEEGPLTYCGVISLALRLYHTGYDPVECQALVDMAGESMLE